MKGEFSVTSMEPNSKKPKMDYSVCLQLSLKQISKGKKKSKKKGLDPEHPRLLIPELCKQFYHLGWVTGTGGGMTIKYGWVDELEIVFSWPSSQWCFLKSIC